MTTPAVVLDGFGYRPANARRWAVRDIDLSIAHGETLLLLGAFPLLARKASDWFRSRRR